MQSENKFTTSPTLFSQDEIPAAVNELFSYPKFLTGMKAFLPDELFHYILENKTNITSSQEFQERLIRPFLQYIIRESTDGLTSSGLNELSKDQKYLFISNHRDIGLDSAFLNLVLFDHGFSTCQIAIGDNLMKHRVAELAFKINKSFAVNRSGSPREIYHSSSALSKYIFSTIAKGVDSVWIAQREGRAKDGNDITQISVLKMLGLSSSGDLLQHFRQLNIVPVAITYELDPCDALKTKEHIAKLQNPNYKKTFEEDMNSILQGFRGMKGKVHVSFGTPLTNELPLQSVDIRPKDLLAKVAKLIDRQIHGMYHINKINLLAYDLISGKGRSLAKYDESLLDYFKKIIHLFPSEYRNEASSFLLSMYSNPVINQNQVQT